LPEYEGYEWDKDGLPLKDAKKNELSNVKYSINLIFQQEIRNTFKKTAAKHDKVHQEWLKKQGETKK